MRKRFALLTMPLEAFTPQFRSPQDISQVVIDLGSAQKIFKGLVGEPSTPISAETGSCE
jgi:hypothetical protein